MMDTMTRCLAVDDHPTVRQGLGLMFGQAPDLDLVGSVENGEDVIEAVKRHRPEIVIMDVRLPGIDGISAVKRIAEANSGVKTVMFSAYGDKRLLSDAIAAGGPAACDPHGRGRQAVRGPVPVAGPADVPGRPRGAALRT